MINHETQASNHSIKSFVLYRNDFFKTDRRINSKIHFAVVACISLLILLGSCVFFVHTGEIKIWNKVYAENASAGGRTSLHVQDWKSQFAYFELGFHRTENSAASFADTCKRLPREMLFSIPMFIAQGVFLWLYRGHLSKISSIPYGVRGSKIVEIISMLHVFVATILFILLKECAGIQHSLIVLAIFIILLDVVQPRLDAIYRIRAGVAYFTKVMDEGNCRIVLNKEYKTSPFFEIQEDTIIQKAPILLRSEEQVTLTVRECAISTMIFGVSGPNISFVQALTSVMFQFDPARTQLYILNEDNTATRVYAGLESNATSLIDNTVEI